MNLGLKRKKKFLICIALIFSYWLVLKIHNSSYDGTKLLTAYEDLLEITNELRISLILIDTRILKIINTLLNTNTLFKDEFSLEVKKLSSKCFSLGTFDSHWTNKARILQDLSKVFSILKLTAYKKSNKDLFKNISSTPHHYILTHKSLKVNFHLVLLRNFEKKYYFVDVIDKKVLENGLNSLQYGIDSPAVFEVNVLKTHVIRFSDFSIRIPKNISKFIHAKQQSTFIECNHSVVKQFKQINAVKLSDEKFVKKLNDVEFRNEALDLLERVSSALYSLGVPFWLSSGTCLGWYRQCGLIAYSRDVDIGIFVKDHHPSITAYLQAYNLVLTHSFGTLNDSYELSFTNGQLKLDIFFFYDEYSDDLGGNRKHKMNDVNEIEGITEEGGFVWNGGTDVYTAKKYKYKFRRFNLCWTLFYAKLMVRVPCETEKYLEDNYGMDWIQVVENWDWMKSPNNVAENGVWSEEMMKCCVNMY